VRAHASSHRMLIYGLLGLMVLLVLWYFFRPERLWINKTVNEPAPHSALTPAASTIASVPSSEDLPWAWSRTER
jgi:hypothetical protein